MFLSFQERGKKKRGKKKGKLMVRSGTAESISGKKVNKMHRVYTETKLTSGSVVRSRVRVQFRDRVCVR